MHVCIHTYPCRYEHVIEYVLMICYISLIFLFERKLCVCGCVGGNNVCLLNIDTISFGQSIWRIRINFKLKVSSCRVTKAQYCIKTFSNIIELHMTFIYKRGIIYRLLGIIKRVHNLYLPLDTRGEDSTRSEYFHCSFHQVNQTMAQLSMGIYNGFLIHISSIFSIIQLSFMNAICTLN